MSIQVDQDILRLKIPVKNLPLVQIFKGEDYFNEYYLSLFFIEFNFLKMKKKFSSCIKIKQKVQMLLTFKGSFKIHKELMIHVL